MYLPKPTEGGDFTPPPEGTFPAICYRFIDLGTQTTAFKGEEKTQRKIMLSWELKDEETVMDDGTPLSAHRRYTWSMHQRAMLRKHLEAWRGKKFEDSDFGPGGFDARNLLSKACLVSITHTEGNEGRIFGDVASITKMPKGMSAGQLINPPVFLSLEPSEFDKVVFEALSENLKNIIKRSPEYQRLSAPSNGRPANGNAYRAQSQPARNNAMPPEDDTERWGPSTF
jgi:hypothetical protein